ncbi:MAG TPA: protein phosphatase 2C domain-containing protein [Gemmataceae bacterium]
MTSSPGDTTPYAIPWTAPLEPPHPFSSRVRVEVGAVSDIGKVRALNEDAFLVYRLGRYLEPLGTNLPPGSLPERFDETGYILAVADGMGGHAAGDVASRLALRAGINLVLWAVKWALKLDHPAEGDAEVREASDRVSTYFRQINQTLTQEGQKDPRLYGMGTTLTVAYTVGNDLFVFHVGDSRAYLYRGGRLRRLTPDDTVAQALVNLGELSPEEAARHHMRHVLTQVLGGRGGDVKAHIHHQHLADGDRLLLCTDGLTDLVADAEIAAGLASYPSPDDACKVLLAQALDRGGKDNVTIVLARYAIPGAAE